MRSTLSTCCPCKTTTMIPVPKEKKITPQHLARKSGYPVMVIAVVVKENVEKTGLAFQSTPVRYANGQHR
jgi:hypothetical protein